MSRSWVALSLDWELGTLARAVDGARLIVDRAGEDPDPSEGREVASAILGLVESRLGLLSTVVRGELDPVLVAARHNAVREVELDSELAFWDEVRKLEHHEAEFQRLQRRLRRVMSEGLESSEAAEADAGASVDGSADDDEPSSAGG